MDVSIQGRGIDLSAEIRDYLTRKLSRLDRHLHSQAQGVVEITRSRARSAEDRLVVEITISSNGMLLRGEQSGADLHAAIDAVADVLDRKITRFKDRRHRRGRVALSRSLTEPVEAEAPEEPDLDDGRVVRVKKFLLEPMTPDDAADQMELLGHDFYVFLNTTSDRLAVIYRRRDGDYGLLDPQLP